MNKSFKVYLLLNTSYWLFVGVLEAVGFFPGITLKVSQSRQVPQWDATVLEQYWDYILRNSIPKYLILWVLGFGIMFVFFRIKHWTVWKLAIGLIAASLLHAVFQALAGEWMNISSGPNFFLLLRAQVSWLVVLIALLGTSISYWLFIVALFAFDYFQRYREERIINLELSNSLHQTKLESLIYQLRPHFLFNTLNAISMSVRAQKNDQAVEIITDLSDLLRTTLKGDQRRLIPFSEEMEFCRKYLELEEKLYSDQLEIRIDVPDEVRGLKFPHFMLQPIIENAFKHGISNSLSKARIEIKARREADRFVVEVINSGAELPENWKWTDSKGIGLNNVVSRLRNLFPNDHQFEIANAAKNQVRVKIEIPAEA